MKEAVTRVHIHTYARTFKTCLIFCFSHMIKKTKTRKSHSDEENDKKNRPKMKPKNNAVLRRESFGCTVKTDGMNTDEVLQSNRGNGEMCGWDGIFKQVDDNEIVFVFYL